MSPLFRLIYTSRNLLGGSEDEQAAAVAGILAASKRNNARVGVTGALLFNAGAFAQVLEGPREAVEATFERIQRDPRHSDVSVLQCEPTTARGFPNWSMAFAGYSERGRALWGEMAHRSDFDIQHVQADVLFSKLLTIVEDEETTHLPPAAPPPRPSRGLDVEALRSALLESVTERLSPNPAGALASAEVGVLRAALDEERGRTTALRRELDEVRVALAGALAEVAAVGQARDVWAERTRAMATVICREPDRGRAAVPGRKPDSPAQLGGSASARAAP